MPTNKPKKTVKKAVKKVVKKATKPRVAKPKAEFAIKVLMNGAVLNCETNELKKALMALAPKMLKTKVVIRVSNKYSFVERVLMIQNAKRLWLHEMVMDVFIKNILLGLKNG